MPMPQNDMQPDAGQQTQQADPFADDFVTQDELALVPEATRSKILTRYAALSRDNRRMEERLAKFNQAPVQPMNGNGHEAPEKPAFDLNKVETWSDEQLEQALNNFDMAEAAYAGDSENEKAKAMVTDLAIRQHVNKARMELGRRAGAKGADERVAPLEAKSRAQQEAESVFGQVMKHLSQQPRLGGAQNVSRLLSESIDDVTARLAAVGKTRETATPHEVGMAMIAAVEGKVSSSNRDGDDGLGHRRRPEIAGEGFGSRGRPGAPNGDAKVSALLNRVRAGQERESVANREMIARLFEDPSYQPPADYVPRSRMEF